MPKNNQKNILQEFNNLWETPDIKASLKSIKNKEYSNNLFKLVYGYEQSSVAIEKTRIFNEFFADLFDVSDLKWKIVNRLNQPLVKISDFLNKYLKKSNFPSINWAMKFKAGMQGKYALVITKQYTGKKVNGEKESTVVLIPARIAYKNTINNNIFEIEVIYDDFPMFDNQSTYLLKRKFSIKDNAVAVDTSLINLSNEENVDLKKIDDNFLKKIPDLNIKELDWTFLPVCVLTNDYEELPRTSKIKERLMMLNKFDEVTAILPFWEKGTMITNGSGNMTANSERENADFMKKYLLDGLIQVKPIDFEGLPQNLEDNAMIINPPSIMQTIRNTRNDIFAEIKSDIGIPNIDEIKSAQQSTAELMVRQFLTSPIIERETIFMKKFLIDLAYKFLKILSTCNIRDSLPFKPEDLDEFEFDVELDVNTDKNVSNIIQQANRVNNENLNDNEKGENNNE